MSGKQTVCLLLLADTMFAPSLVCVPHSTHTPRQPNNCNNIIINPTIDSLCAIGPHHICSVGQQAQGDSRLVPGLTVLHESTLSWCIQSSTCPCATTAQPNLFGHQTCLITIKLLHQNSSTLKTHEQHSAFHESITLDSATSCYHTEQLRIKQHQ